MTKTNSFVININHKKTEGGTEHFKAAQFETQRDCFHTLCAAAFYPFQKAILPHCRRNLSPIVPSLQTQAALYLPSVCFQTLCCHCEINDNSVGTSSVLFCCTSLPTNNTTHPHTSTSIWLSESHCWWLRGTSALTHRMKQMSNSPSSNSSGKNGETLFWPCQHLEIHFQILPFGFGTNRYVLSFQPPPKVRFILAKHPKSLHAFSVIT